MNRHAGNPMLYYRFRPKGELALKELLYDEIFLASSAECNDPYDGIALLAFGADRDKWRRLFDVAWAKLTLADRDLLVDGLVDRVIQDCPLTYGDAVAYDFQAAIQELMPAMTELLAGALTVRIRGLLELYQPRPPLFASFSRSPANPLMWSHYASMHQGHCLIFRDLDGHLEQCPRRTRTGINRTTPRGLAPRMSTSVPLKFPLQEVLYESTSELEDAFAYMPASVFGMELTEAKRRDLVEGQRRGRLTKHAAWEYEREVRITFSPGTPSILGEHVECTPLERLLHFRPTQLVGVILGARTTREQRARIHEICRHRLDRIATEIGKREVEEPLFDFVIFEAGLLGERRDLVINPVEILNLGQSFYPDEAKFAERLQRWEDGWALVFRSRGGTSKRQYK